MNKKKNIYWLVILFILTGCITSNNGSDKYQAIEVKFILVGYASQDSLISQDLISLLKPIKSDSCNNNFIGYDEKIHFVDINSDSSKNIEVKANTSFFEKHWFGEPNSKKKSEEIESYLSNAIVPSELLNVRDETTQHAYLMKYIAKNPDYVTLAFGENSNLSNIPLYNSIDTLKNAIANLACKNKTKKFLIILSKGEKPIVNGPINDNSRMDNTRIRQILLKINQLSSLGFTQRKVEVDKILETYFADAFSVSLNHETYNPSIAKEIKSGRDYLDRLASDTHIKDIKVNGVQKDSKGKITHMNVVEIKKTDIDVQVN